MQYVLERALIWRVPYIQMERTFMCVCRGIVEGDKYTIRDEGVLEIADFSLADEGLYTCIGSNTYSQAERSFYPKTSES